MPRLRCRQRRLQPGIRRTRSSMLATTSLAASLRVLLRSSKRPIVGPRRNTRKSPASLVNRVPSPYRRPPMALLWWAGGRRCGSLWPVVLRPISFAAALCIMVQASRFCKTTPRASRCYGPRPPLSVPLPRVVTGDELGDDGCCLRLCYGLARHGRCRFRTSHLTITLTPKRFGYLLVIAKRILLTQGVVFQMV